MMIAAPRARTALALIGATGTLAFGFFLALTLHTPEWVESFAASFIEREVAKRVDASFDLLQPPAEGSGILARAATALYRQNAEEIERQRELLRQRAHERMADVIAEARRLDCECRDKWAAWLKEGSTVQIQRLQISNAGIVDFIQASYARVVTDLKRDIRIFAGANGLVFLSILLLAIARPRASLQLLVPGLLAALAALICSWFYVFEQNWLLTIIYNNYLGFTYFAYLGMVFALLCDVVLNRARVCTEILNAMLSAIGSATSVVPC